MYKNIISIVMLVGLMLSAGCATFHANDLQTVEASELQTAPKDKIKIFSRWNVETTSLNDVQKAATAGVYKKHFEDALALANCCTVVDSTSDADLILEGKAYAESNGAALIGAMITGLSLYTIPSWVTIKVHLAADVKATKAKAASKSYELKDSAVLVQWLPMLFAMPFTSNPFTGEEKLYQNTFQNLILNIKKDGFLN